LERVKNFLPKIHQANLELKNQILQGNSSDVLLDSDLVADEDQVIDLRDSSVNEVRILLTLFIYLSISAHSIQKLSENSVEQKVQIVFALGDFDGTAIATAEEE